MKKILSKWYVILGIVCIIGFSVGFFANKFSEDKVSPTVNASESVTNISPMDWDAEEIDCTDIFNEGLYTTIYNESDRTIYVSAKEDMSTKALLAAERYTADDAKYLATLMLGDDYELRLIDQADCGCMYEEYKDGHQTGGLATYLFDSDGYISEASFREGSVYDFDENGMISKELAFELAVEAIKEKYGADTVVEGTVDDYEITTYYVPKRDEICYWIDRITGHVQKYVGTISDPVHFYVTVSPDGTFVEVASSLRY